MFSPNKKLIRLLGSLLATRDINNL